MLLNGYVSGIFQTTAVGKLLLKGNGKSLYIEHIGGRAKKMFPVDVDLGQPVTF